LVIIVIAVLVVAGIAGYIFLGNKQSNQESNSPASNTSAASNPENNVKSSSKINQSNPLDIIYSAFFSCINQCPSGSCPQPNCRPDYSSGRGASIGWVGECKTGSFTDCINPTCFDKCSTDRDASLKSGNFKGMMPSSNIWSAITCSDASGTKGKDCVTIVNTGTASKASYKQYLKYGCANSCWQDVI